MKTINIADSIRSLRKEKGLTQEKLAQVMNVTVGAVSKWESGASVPDLGMILELADFFETSVDVLLGYGWQKGGMGEAVARIRALRDDKRFDEAALEAEKALVKYPNSFDVTFAGAVMYSMRGVEKQEQKSFRRALSLYERSLELISQNRDAQISEWTINNHIADLYLCMGQTDRALERMKNNNIGGTKNIDIGFTLSTGKGDVNEALDYLTRGLIDSATNLMFLARGYAAAYTRRGEHKKAFDVLKWYCDCLERLRTDRVCVIDRMLAQMDTACAAAALRAGDEMSAKECLTSAVRSAERFDKAPCFDFSGMRFQRGGEERHMFDDFGATALDGVEGLASKEADVGESLRLILKEIKNE